MNSDPMIVRVAHAIARTEGGDWRDYMTAARAAIAAMREPTVEMLEAAVPGLPDWGSLPGDWRVMIDHVIATECC